MRCDNIPPGPKLFEYEETVTSSFTYIISARFNQVWLNLISVKPSETTKPFLNPN